MKASAARAAVVRAWIHVATRYPSAPAKTPVTPIAYQTVPPCGIRSCPSDSATAVKPMHDTAIWMQVSARAS